MPQHGMQSDTYSSVKLIVPSDTVIQNYSAWMVTVSGVVNVRFVDGSTATLSAVPAYVLMPFPISGILATSTTATGIIGMN